MFFSTPNLNFIIEADKNKSFRDSVIQSDLVLLDGMPPVWVARWLGIPGIKKVSGSDLFDTLSRKVLPENEKIKVFLFGGEDGVAAKACQKINDSSPALECSGFHNPGFGSVTEMGKEEIWSKINASEASFIVVSLGAKKGQDWIMANQSKLMAPVISHLGAVVNIYRRQYSSGPWLDASRGSGVVVENLAGTPFVEALPVRWPGFLLAVDRLRTSIQNLAWLQPQNLIK